MINVGKNWDFNQMRGRFMLHPSSLFFNYALLGKFIVNFLFNKSNGNKGGILLW